MLRFEKVLAEKRGQDLVHGEDEGKSKGERNSAKLKVSRASTVAPGTQQVVECMSQD